MPFLWLLIAQISLSKLVYVQGNKFSSNCSAVGAKKVYISWSMNKLNKNLNYSYSVLFCKDYATNCGNKFSLGCVVNSSNSRNNTCDIGKSLQLNFPREFKFWYYIRVDNGLTQREDWPTSVCYVNIFMRCTDPTGLTLKATRKRTLMVKWTTPTDMGIFTYLCYRFIYSKHGSNNTLTEERNLDNLSYTLRSLLPYMEYSLWVQCALDCSDNSQWSNIVGPITARTLEEIPLGTVQIVDYKKEKEDKLSRNISITVYFQLPSKEMWNGNVTHVKIYCYVGSTLCRTKKVSPREKSISFQALDSDREYRLQGEYCNNEGCSNRSHYYTILGDIQKSQEFDSKTPDKGTENHNLIRGVAIGLTVVFIFIIIIVGCILYHRHKNKNHGPTLHQEVGDLEEPHSGSDDNEETRDLTNGEYASVVEGRSRTTLNADTADFQSASARSLDSVNISFAEQSSLQNASIQPQLVRDNSHGSHEQIELTEVTAR